MRGLREWTDTAMATIIVSWPSSAPARSDAEQCHEYNEHSCQTSFLQGSIHVLFPFNKIVNLLAVCKRQTNSLQFRLFVRVVGRCKLGMMLLERDARAKHV